MPEYLMRKNNEVLPNLLTMLQNANFYFIFAFPSKYPGGGIGRHASLRGW